MGVCWGGDYDKERSAKYDCPATVVGCDMGYEQPDGVGEPAEYVVCRVVGGDVMVRS